MESTLKLLGWSRERRVILVREAPARAPVSGAVIELNAGAMGTTWNAAKRKRKRRGKDRQSDLPNATGEGWDAQATPWSGKMGVTGL
jgi:hypothetical protein